MRFVTDNLIMKSLLPKTDAILGEFAMDNSASSLDETNDVGDGDWL